ncbi:MAG: alpha/beta fold hydrolase [Candidatus Sulfotelmatobacter sp.]|jgi:acetyl esterase/lipase
MNSEDILSLPAPKADARLAYGGDANQFLDLRRPMGKGSHALAIAIHGGYWRAKYDLAYMGHLCAALTSNGIVTANLEYRRVGNPGGGWPGTFADVRAAYQFLLQNAQPHGIDSARIVAIGHSAGGQLALCLAAHEPGVRAAISLAGVIDLLRAYELHLSNDAVVEFLGGTPAEVADHYREADPMKLAIAARQWLVHGAADDVVPPAFSREYVRAKSKEKVRLVEIAGAGHFELVDPRSGAWKQVESAVIEATKP